MQITHFVTLVIFKDLISESRLIIRSYNGTMYTDVYTTYML